MPWHTRWAALDRRWIFAAMFVLVLLPLLSPIRLPLAIDSAARHYYAAIEALPAGSTVLMPFDYDPAFTAENHPMAVATLRRLLEKNVRVIAVTLQPAAPPLADLAFRTVGPPLHKKYGIDFVNLGYKSGNEVVVLALGTSIKHAFPLDSHGTPVASLPLLREVDRIGEMKMIVEIAGTSAGNIWVQQAQGRFHVPMVAGVTGVMAPEFFPYLQAGQIKGMLGGMAGAAEYEFLLHRADTATKGMDAQSMAHLLIIVLILTGNLMWLAGRRDDRRRHAARGAGVAIILVALGVAVAGCGGGSGGGHGGHAGASAGPGAAAGTSGEDRANAPPDTARDGHAFVATYDDGPVDQIRIGRDTAGGIVAAGSTSFPDGTRITVALERPRPDRPREFEAVATTQGEVRLGRFSSTPLKPPTGPLPTGPAHLRITASFGPGAQSPDVLSATGNGRRFRGQGMHEVGAYSIYEVDLEAPI
jgi:hypothetical protein